MRITLKIDSQVYGSLLNHLLPEGDAREQAAFLFAQGRQIHDEYVLEVIEVERLLGRHFIVQESNYLEMSDPKRAELIKRAHDLEASLVEVHSHLGPWPAAFSSSDRTGLKETVRHMWWRLKRRPYGALVVTKFDFDALLWLENPNKPRPLDGLVVGKKLLKPTNNSLRGW